MTDDIAFSTPTPHTSADDVRVTDYRVMPWPDGTRVTVEVGLAPFRQFPDMDITITSTDGKVLCTTSLVGAAERRPAPTLHLPTCERGAPLVAHIEMLRGDTVTQHLAVAFEVGGGIVKGNVNLQTSSPAHDSFGRRMHYLRVSLTDKCNLRCVYCMPEQAVFRPNDELLTDEELLTVLRAANLLGFDKYRLTGGEPTLRPNLVGIVGEIANLPGTREIAMTTNGVKLAQLAGPLKAAGLNRVNISIDSLDPDKFRRITRWGRLDDVLAGIRAAEDAGLVPIKLNSVVMRHFNTEDLIPLAALTLEHAWQVRFLEVMPFAGAAEFQQAAIVTTREMIERLEATFGPLAALNGGRLDGEAQVYRLPGAQGEVGFISPVSAPFCASCNRVRLTADGTLRLCLLKDGELDLRTPLRQGATASDLAESIRAAIWHKPWGHDLANGVIPMSRIMSQIGG